MASPRTAAETALGSPIDDVTYERLELLAELATTAPLNLVAARDREPTRFWTRHVVESLAIAGQLPCGEGERWLDLGTGGGLPGLVLALVHPLTDWVLVDSVAKKVAAVERFAHALELTNVAVRCGRAESLARHPDLRGRHQGVVARAVAPLVVLAELARGFVRPDGWLVAAKGPGYVAELGDLRQVAHSLRWRGLSATWVPYDGGGTWLVTMRASGPPPSRFPRGDGIPAHRPLHAS